MFVFLRELFLLFAYMDATRGHEAAMVANTLILYLLLYRDSMVDASPRSSDAHKAHERLNN
jgi:hypothetical protein